MLCMESLLGNDATKASKETFRKHDEVKEVVLSLVEAGERKDFVFVFSVDLLEQHLRLAKDLRI